MPDVGFMQGRLSPLVDGRIQAFPRDHWRDEFPLAQAIGLGLMEWTLDAEGLYDNPFMTEAGRAEINALSARHKVRVASATGDLFMQRPFYKARGDEREALVGDMLAVIQSTAALGARDIVMPLVDDGRLENRAQEADLLEGLDRAEPLLRRLGVRLLFETDYAPSGAARFIGRLATDVFGINYDIGNSAALGYDLGEEMAAYGHRILGVHVKDRILGGGTVPLGSGNADLPFVAAALVRAGYRGNWILQTARAEDHDHAGVLARYADMTRAWIALAKDLPEQS